MPIYEYRCRGCRHGFEVLQRLGEGAEGLACPGCGAATLDKQFSTFATGGGGGGTASFEGDAGCGAADCGAGACCGGGACGLDSFN